GYEVVLPRGGVKSGTRTLREWHQAGVRRPGGKPFPRPGDSATLFAPAGNNGPAFLMLKNFSVIKRYNNADAYALAVGHLADRLAGYDAFHGTWPWKEPPLSENERARLQTLLSHRGYYDGEIDGKRSEEHTSELQ